MQIDTIPIRGDQAISASAVLFEEFNDIDIYVEDSAKAHEKIFVQLFSRLFMGEFSISKVFSLSGKQPVIDACLEAQGSFSRPSLYIIDGDLNLLRGDPSLNLAGLYRLPVYCMENILIDERAVLEVLNEEDEIQSKLELERKLNFEEWLNSNFELLSDLFTEYCVCHHFCPEVTTISYPVQKLTSSDNGILDEDKVERRIGDLKNKVLEEVKYEDYIAKRLEIENRFKEGPETILKYSSAKDYLFPLLFTRSRSIVKMNMKHVIFKLKLASRCNLLHLEGCKVCVVGHN